MTPHTAMMGIASLNPSYGLAKQIAGTLLPAVRGEGEAQDAVTREILRQVRAA